MRNRNWSIRSKITVLLLVPLLALVVLWGFATSLTVPPVLSLLNFRTTTQDVGLPGEVLVTELQRERRLSLVYLGGREVVLPALDEQRTRTDEAAGAFRSTAGGKAAQDAAGSQGRHQIAAMFEALDRLPAGRTAIDQRDFDRAGALKLYNGLLDIAFRMLTPRSDIGDRELADESRTLNSLARARELLTREDALVSGAIVGGWFAKGETAQVIQLIGMQRYLYADAAADLPPDAAADYQRLVEDPAYIRLRAMEDQIVAKARDGASAPVDARQWQQSFETVVGAVRDFEVEQGRAVADRAEPVAVGIVLRLALAGILGLLAVIAAVLISLRIGRSLVTRLAGLRRDALDLAENRLPGIVTRLRRGEKIDIATETPPLEYGADEIGQVGRAFTEAQRTAVRSAVDEADMRKGLNETFLNIARRSQTLVHRQLALLDKMERRATKPEDLEYLFQVDHLATRMRRHSEDLVILAGSQPGRGWRHPVPVIDVIRGAISEVEDYARVTVAPIEDVAVIGPVVGDIIHLLAELIENATSFSPPNTKVRVAGQTVPNGYVVEIEDRGLGMPSEEIAEANDRLSASPEFDPANSARLGLFVVAKLAHRHGVSVQLRSSPYGGVTAVVLIPIGLMVADHAGVPQLPGIDRPLPVLPGASPVTVQEVEQPTGVRGLRAAPRAGISQRPAMVPVERPDQASEPDTGEETAPVAAPAGGGAAVRATVPVAGPVARPSSTPVVLSEDGLPRRVRQANLAPQLLDQSEPAAAPVEEPEAAPRRSPEQIRSRMSALQAGTRRGRIEGATPRSQEARQPEVVVSPVERAGSAEVVVPPPAERAGSAGVVVSPPTEPPSSPEVVSPPVERAGSAEVVVSPPAERAGSAEVVVPPPAERAGSAEVVVSPPAEPPRSPEVVSPTEAAQPPAVSAPPNRRTDQEEDV